MSVRAYLIEKYAFFETFNLWHDKLFMHWLRDNNLLDTLSIYGVGIISIDKDNLTKLKKFLKKNKKELIKKYGKEEIKRTYEIIKDIEEDFKKLDQDYATYYCF